jgi:hypothetical protein
MAQVGYMYLRGVGTDSNSSEGIKWYRRGADAGDMTAQTHLGTAYKSGNGVERDLGKAAEWYRKAADQGYPFAQRLLAELEGRE